MKLNIGCGDVYLPGWINIDLDSSRADLKHDLRTPLPYEDNSISFIYNEHFIEHVTVNEAVNIMKEFHRVLKKNGVMRIATPDLDYLIFKYIFRWKHQDWIKKYGYDWIKTKAEMLNICFREWGHQYIYNEEELKRRLQEAGFKQIYREKLNKSKYSELKNRETRTDSKLILEALK